MTIEDESLLNILQAQGQQFLESFGVPENNKKRKCSSGSGSVAKLAKRETATRTSSVDFSDSAEEEEWSGFGSGTHIEEDEGWKTPLLAEEVTHLEASTSGQQPDVIVFSGSATIPKSSEASFTKAQARAFMSSKVSRLSDQKLEHRKEHTDDEDDNDNDDLTNAQNDALLHRLIHTQLLSGSLNPELNLTSAQRKKALEGRVLELAGKSKLGQGEKIVRATERDKASKRIREGILEKQKQRREKVLQEAKEMGNYHPSSKRLFEDLSEKNTKRNRERGLRMGVGSFGGGMLRLSQQEIEMVQGGPTGNRMRSRRHNEKLDHRKRR